MKLLNRDAAQLAVDFGLHAATDITGFGFLGHATEMAEASGVALRVHYPSIPLMKAAQKFAYAYTFLAERPTICSISAPRLVLKASSHQSTDPALRPPDQRRAAFGRPGGESCAIPG